MSLLRTISGRVRSFRAIQSAVTHHGQRVARQLDARFNPQLPESLRIDFWSLLQAFFELMRRSCDSLMEAEHHLVGERGNDNRKQKKRDSDAQKMSAAILGLRNAFTGVYKPANVEEYGFPQVLGRSPFDLLRQGDYLLQILDKPDVSLPSPLYTGGLDLPKELATIRQIVEELRLSIDEAEGELKLAQAAKVDKDRAQGEWDSLFAWGARIITGLFVWAGETELAGYINPSARRPGRTRQVARQERQAEADGTELPDDEVTDGGVLDEDVPDDGDGVSDGDEVSDDQAPDDETSGAAAPGETDPDVVNG